MFRGHIEETMHQRLLRVMPIVCAIVLFSVMSVGYAEPGTAGARVTVHLRVTGALVDTVTLSHPLQASNYGCRAETSPTTVGGPSLTVLYDFADLNLANYAQREFSLDVQGYSRSRSHYADPKNIIIFLSLRGKSFESGGKGGRTVDVQDGGRKGRFHATLLVNNSPRHLVSVRGTWRCDAMEKA